jgi:hypothetical protein
LRTAGDSDVVDNLFDVYYELQGGFLAVREHASIADAIRSDARSHAALASAILARAESVRWRGALRQRDRRMQVAVAQQLGPEVVRDRPLEQWRIVLDLRARAGTETNGRDRG